MLCLNYVGAWDLATANSHPPSWWTCYSGGFGSFHYGRRQRSNYPPPYLCARSQRSAPHRKGRAAYRHSITEQRWSASFWKQDRNVLTATEDFKRFRDALHKLRDVQLICIDPLASFSHAPINEDPAAGQFVCTSLANLAAELDATVLTAITCANQGKVIRSKHLAMRARPLEAQLLSLTECDWDMRYGQLRKTRAVKYAGSSVFAYLPNSVVRGGVVKANGPSSRMIATYIRDKTGLLIDRSALLRMSAPKQYDLMTLLRDVIADHAKDGQPFTRTGLSGLFAPSCWDATGTGPSSGARLEKMAEELL